MTLTGKYSGRLNKITSTHINLRTNEVIGFFNSLPELHHPFQIISEPLDSTKDFREVTTTPIQSITFNEGVYRFKTKNSEYQLEVFPTETEKVLDNGTFIL